MKSVFTGGIRANAAECYYGGAALTLSTIGLVKIWTLLLGSAAVRLYDPLLGIPNTQVLGCTAFIELAIGGIALLSRNALLRCLSVLWVSTNFAIYQIWLHAANPSFPCPCLGSLLYLPGRHSLARGLLVLATGYLLIGSAWLLALEWRRRQSGLREKRGREDKE